MNQMPESVIEWKEAQLSQEIWILILTQVLCSWVALGRSLNLSGSKYLICEIYDVIIKFLSFPLAITIFERAMLISLVHIMSTSRIKNKGSKDWEDAEEIWDLRKKLILTLKGE